VVLADAAAVAGAEQELAKAADLLQATLLLADVAADDGVRHDPVRLAAAFRAAFSTDSTDSAGLSGDRF
jgi:hypothetical protein